MIQDLLLIGAGICIISIIVGLVRGFYDGRDEGFMDGLLTFIGMILLIVALVALYLIALGLIGALNG